MDENPHKDRYIIVFNGRNVPLVLTLKVLAVTTDAQWEGMGDVGSSRHFVPHARP